MCVACVINWLDDVMDAKWLEWWDACDVDWLIITYINVSLIEECYGRKEIEMSD